MKILLVSASSGSRGGGEIFLLYLGRVLAARGHEVTLWCSTHPRMDGLAEAFAAFGNVARAQYVNTYDRWGRCFAAALDTGCARAAARQWQKVAPDIIHLNKQNLEDGLDLVEAVRLCGLPVLGTIHLTQTMTELRAVLGRARDSVARKSLVRWPGYWVAVGEKRAHMLEKFLGNPGNVRCVENGVPVPGYDEIQKWRLLKRKELGITDQEKLVVAVGRLVEQKRPQFFLDVARRWSAEDQQTRFVWIGDGNFKEKWDSLVQEYDLSPQVTQTGWKPDVAAYLAAADMYFHLAQFEGLPLSLLEAMATGLPCGVSENLMAELPFLTAENCWTIPESEPFALPQAEALAALGRNARHLVEKKFSVERMAENYETLYQQLIRQQE
jgi:glycosyltransferase involved in cell wall biosynthesis